MVHVCIVPTSIIIIIARIICLDKCDAMRLFCFMDIRCYIAAQWCTSLSRLIRVDCHDMFDASSYYWCPRWVEVYEAHRFQVSGSFNEDKAYACGLLDLLLLINTSPNRLIIIIISDAVTAHLKDGNQQEYWYKGVLKTASKSSHLIGGESTVATCDAGLLCRLVITVVSIALNNYPYKAWNWFSIQCWLPPLYMSVQYFLYCRLFVSSKYLYFCVHQIYISIVSFCSNFNHWLLPTIQTN